MIQSSAINWGSPISQNSALNAGLLAWWLARTSIGGLTWYDLCGLSHGTLTNGAAFKTGYRTGNNASVTLDGSNDYVNGIPTTSVVQNTGQMSVFAWINTTTVGAGGKHVVASNSSGVPAAFRLLLNATAAKIGAGWNSSTLAASTTSLVANTWTHIGWVRTGGTGSWTVTFYLNGSPDGSTGSIATNPSNGTQLHIGDNSAGAGPFSGNIDDIRVYNRALSSGEVLQLYSDSLAGYPQTLNRLPRRWGYVAAAGGFKPAWARNSTTLVGAGSCA